MIRKRLSGGLLTVMGVLFENFMTGYAVHFT
jgi:hypothetical protein